jgi:hypothetical protein
MAALPLIGLGLSVASTGLQVAGGIAQGKAAKAEANYKAQVAANNAVIAKQNAQYELQRGGAEFDQQNLETRRVLGAQRAAQAASGVDLNFGTPVSLRETAAGLGALDAATIQNNAERRANDYLAQAGNFTAESGLQRMSGKNAQSAGYLKAFGSLIGGASDVSDRWSTYKSRGLLV